MLDTVEVWEEAPTILSSFTVVSIKYGHVEPLIKFNDDEKWVQRAPILSSNFYQIKEEPTSQRK